MRFTRMAPRSTTVMFCVCGFPAVSRSRLTAPRILRLTLRQIGAEPDPKTVGHRTDLPATLFSHQSQSPSHRKPLWLVFGTASKPNRQLPVAPREQVLCASVDSRRVVDRETEDVGQSVGHIECECDR